MFQRASSIVGLLVLMGCQHPAAPTVVVEAQRAAPAEHGGASRARRPLPAPCPDSGPVRLCRSHPSCKAPWGTTQLDQECHLLEWVDFEDSARASQGDACSLVSLSARLKAFMEVNQAHWPTLPQVSGAITRYQRASEELSTTARQLAKALQNGDPADVASARERFSSAIPEHHAASRWALYTCAPEHVIP